MGPFRSVIVVNDLTDFTGNRLVNRQTEGRHDRIKASRGLVNYIVILLFSDRSNCVVTAVSAEIRLKQVRFLRFVRDTFVHQ